MYEQFLAWSGLYLSLALFQLLKSMHTCRFQRAQLMKLFNLNE